MYPSVVLNQNYYIELKKIIVKDTTKSQIECISKKTTAVSFIVFLNKK